MSHDDDDDDDNYNLWSKLEVIHSFTCLFI